MTVEPSSINAFTLVQRVAYFGGLSADEAGHALRAALGALGEHLNESDVLALARALPAELAEVLAARRHGQSLAQDDLYDRAHAYEGVTLGFAREHVQAVCRALGESLAPELVDRLSRALPPGLADHLRGRPTSPPPAHTHPTPARLERTLAVGRAGSEHPVSDSRPVRAQTHSVVREDNPHGDTKLSSATGSTQRRR